MKIRRRLALAHVAGPVHAYEEERHAARVAALEGAQAMADGLEPHAEPPRELIDIVMPTLRRRQEWSVGQNQGAGEVVGEPDASEATRLRMGKGRLVRQTVDRLAALDE